MLPKTETFSNYFLFYLWQNFERKKSKVVKIQQQKSGPNQSGLHLYITSIDFNHNQALKATRNRFTSLLHLGQIF